MSLIDVPNLKEIQPWKGCFYVVQKFFKIGAKKKKKKKKKKEKKNVKKMGQFLEAYILHTTNPISFKFDMQGHVYVEHKICKFGRNPPGSLRDTRG